MIVLGMIVIISIVFIAIIGIVTVVVSSSLCGRAALVGSSVVRRPSPSS